MATKLRINIYLVGNESNQITGGKLPSNRQVFLVFFYNLRVVKLNMRQSAHLAIKETIIFWVKARIPVRDTQHCVAKLENFYQKWRSVQKNRKSRTKWQVSLENQFSETLDDLFDIAHADALNIIRR
ncbi:uncharacterized protein LOC126896392 isoform X2 [Daktulosphaira vitifoliae]|uniref:uncharacterized protein LOC126896392 isoform X2 n=1 Tax=Daktulosphaira vitifoliae TaxID=58002 RepID=UPI0021AAC5D3|nr:uncharacterized protein LOC126896392 isoform X2 [Daktulosphaira vitifoliae]